MEISNKVVWGAVAALALGIALDQAVRHRGRKAAAAPPPQDAAERPGEPPRGFGDLPELADPELADPGASAAPEPLAVANPLDNPVVREQMVNAQVRRMKAYASEAEAGDPFALSPEQIEEFRQRGDPVVW